LTCSHQPHGIGSIGLLLGLLKLSKAKQALKVHAATTHCRLLVGKRSLLAHSGIRLRRTQVLTINGSGGPKTLLAHAKLLAEELCACAHALLAHAKALTKKLGAKAHVLTLKVHFLGKTRRRLVGNAALVAHAPTRLRGYTRLLDNIAKLGWRQVSATGKEIKTSLSNLLLTGTLLELVHASLTKLRLCCGSTKLAHASLLQTTPKPRLCNLSRLRLWHTLRHELPDVIIHRHPAAAKGLRLSQRPRKLWVGRKESLRSPPAQRLNIPNVACTLCACRRLSLLLRLLGCNAVKIEKPCLATAALKQRVDVRKLKGCVLRAVLLLRSQ
jgi:hypothetical protein